MRFGTVCTAATCALMIGFGTVAQRLDAQGIPLKPSILLRLGIGGGRGGTSVDGQSETAEGFIGHAGIGFSGLGTRLLVEAEAQPFEVQNPVLDEAFRAVYVLAAFQVGLLGAYVRPGLGAGVLFFTGDQAADETDIGPAVGVSAGYEIPVHRPGDRRRRALVDLVRCGARRPSLRDPAREDLELLRSNAPHRGSRGPPAPRAFHKSL